MEDRRCAVCNAPLHPWEYKRHTKSCLAIAMPNLIVQPGDGARTHYEDQQAAWRRNKALGHWVPGKDPRAP